jgi:GntR family transcriptional regulator / MocR family aminotransferase
VGRPLNYGIARRITEAVKDQIHRGIYKAGDRLASSRALAAEWGVSRTTVTAAYGQLVAEGYLITLPGARVIVAEGLEQNPTPRPSTPEGTLRRVSAYTERLLALPHFSLPEKTAIADFRYGDLSANDFPALAWRRAMNKAIFNRSAPLRYDQPQGYAPLRKALQSYLWRARGIRCTCDQITIVNGSQQGMDICARLLLNPGDHFVMENPGYVHARQAFETAGGIEIPIPVDGEGLQTMSLPPARLAYVTPSHQFPLGAVLSASRRRALLTWATSNRAYVIEDDYDGEFRHGIAPIAPLQTIDPNSVLFLGTFSKTLSPTLRLGYLIAPNSLSPALARAKRLMDRHSSLYDQQAMTVLLESGAYERHVRSMRRKYAQRRTVFLEALKETLGNSVTIVGSETGLHVLLWLDGIAAEHEADLVSDAHARGIGIYPISPTFDKARSPPTMAGINLGYAALDDSALRQGIAILADVIAKYRSRQTSADNASRSRSRK